MLSGEKKLKQQWDFTTQLLKWTKSKTLTILNAGEYVEQKQLFVHCWWEGNMAYCLWKILDSFPQNQT